MDKDTFQKELELKSEIEPWVYNTFKHPSILPVEIQRGKYSTRLIMSKGIPLNIYISEEEFEKAFANLMNIILFMYRNGMIYGDVKFENMVKYNDNFYLIDMDLVYFYNLDYDLTTQTFAPVRGKDTPLRRLIYALGYFAYRWKRQIKLSKIDDYIRSVYKPLELEKYDKWTPFILEAMENEHASLQDILILLPIKIGNFQGIANYSQTPEYPQIWDDSLDKHNREFYSLAKMFTTDVFIFCLSMELFWRYFKIILNSFSSKTSKNYDDIAKCIFFSSFKLVCTLKNIGVGIGPLSFHGLVETELLKNIEIEFMKILGYRLPSLFRDGYLSGTKVSDDIEEIIYQIGNPTNIQILRRTVRNRILSNEVIKVISDSAYKSYIQA